MNEVVGREVWLEKRRALLAEEKAFTAARDALSARRRAMPWMAVEEDYVFDTEEGPQTLEALFEGRSQLIVYHFMFDPAWDAGCKSCSFIMDHLQHAGAHLSQRDTAFVAVARAPLAKLQAFSKRQGWTHRWASSQGTRFNYDFDVSYDDVHRAEGAQYNFVPSKPTGTESPGLSVFARRDGTVFRTYGMYSRGLEELLTTYRLLDLVPKGRDEEALTYGMAWVALRDRYSD